MPGAVGRNEMTTHCLRPARKRLLIERMTTISREDVYTDNYLKTAH